jgi:hypothetical protein
MVGLSCGSPFCESDVRALRRDGDAASACPVAYPELPGRTASDDPVTVPHAGCKEKAIWRRLFQAPPMARFSVRVTVAAVFGRMGHPWDRWDARATFGPFRSPQAPFAR